MRRKRLITFVGIATASAVSVTCYYLSSPTGLKNLESKKAETKKKNSKKVASGEQRSEDFEENNPEAGESAAQRGIASISTYSQSAKACAPLEIPGRGPASVQVGKAEWDEFMKMYRGVKEQYAAWLGLRVTEENHGSLGWMIESIGGLKVQRPPTVSEPDLAWRGIAVLSHEPSGEPMIRVGDGFLAFMKHEPKRAKFELARAMAQVWAPCAVSSAHKSVNWKELGVAKVEKENCEAPGVSDAAWAVSSAVAVQVADPGCSVPGLATEGGA